jgi:hypothetical protein
MNPTAVTAAKSRPTAANPAVIAKKINASGVFLLVTMPALNIVVSFPPMGD